MIVYIRICVFLSVITGNLVIEHLNAQTTKWIFSEGYALGANITDVEGRKLALDVARAKAVKQVSGLQITEQTYRKIAETDDGKHSQVFDVFSRLSQSSTRGTIIIVEIQKEWTELDKNIPVYKVKIRALVAIESGKPDPNFEVKLIMPKDVYYAGNNRRGEELIFSIRASQDCYLYLFNIMANDSVQLLMPGFYVTDNKYEVEKEKQDFEQVFDNLALEVELPDEREHSIEALYVVALKDKDKLLRYNGAQRAKSYEAAMVDIQKWLIKIPPDRRTDAIQIYEIREKTF